MEYSEGLTAFFISDPLAPRGFGSGYTGPGYWGFLDTEGNEAIPAVFLHVRPFRNGLAVVQTADNRWVYIDREGNEVMAVPEDYFSFDSAMDIIEYYFEKSDKPTIEAGIFDEIKKCCHGLIVVRRGNNWGIISRTLLSQ